MNIGVVLSDIPESLRTPLIDEYNSITQHYLERRWTASELSGGKFCEIIFSILDGHAKGGYPAAPFKPSNFVDACKKLENNANVPRSFQILIPRMLPALYEVRNNRNVGHVGGDVDPNLMDAHVVVSVCSWIMGELVRVFHNISINDAQKIVDQISTRKIPFVWDTGKAKRILEPSISLKNQILLLTASASTQVNTDDLITWIEHKNRSYFFKTLRGLHQSRLIELSKDETLVEILPPGSIYIEGVIAKMKL